MVKTRIFVHELMFATRNDINRQSTLGYKGTIKIQTPIHDTVQQTILIVL